MSKTLTGNYIGTSNRPEQNGGVGYAYDGQLTNLGTVTGGVGGEGENGYAGGIGILMSGGVLTNAAGHQVSGGAGGNAAPLLGGNGGVGGAGVTLDSGASVVNYGVITGGAGGAGGQIVSSLPGQAGDGVDAAGVALVANSGTIEGFIGVNGQGSGNLTITNAGEIDGTGGTAVAFNSATDRLVVLSGAAFVGSVVGGGGTLELANGADTISGLGGSGTLTGSATASFSGFGAYTVDAGAGLTLTGAETVASGKTLTDAGLVTNTGTVGLSGQMLVAATGSLINSGSLTGDVYRSVALAAGGYLLNEIGGMITQTDASEGLAPTVVAYGAATIVNLGGVTGVTGAAGNWVVYLQDGGAVTNGSAANDTALIEGQVGSVGIYAKGSPATITNFGTIQGQLGVAITKGGQATNGAIGDTTALIDGAEYGVLATGGSSSVSNFGTILGTSIYGVKLLVGGSVVNGSGEDGVALIEGHIGILLQNASVSTVTNYGTIDGTGGTAVQFTSASDVLVVEAGSTLIGNAVGYGGTLAFGAGGGAGTVSGLGSGVLTGSAPGTFSGFGGYLVSGEWTITNTNSLAAGQGLTNAVTVTEAGALTLANGAVTNDAGAIWDITSDNGVALAAGDTGTFANAGLLEKTGGTGTSHLAATLTGAGSLDVETGTLELDGGGSVGGAITIASSATLETEVGAFTIDGATVINAGTLEAFDPSGAGLVIEDTTVDNAGGTITSANSSVTLNGAVIQGGTLTTTLGGQIFAIGDGDTLDGSTTAGSVINEGEIVLSGDDVYFGLTGEIDNTGTLQVQDDGHLYANTAGATLSGGGQVVMSDGIVLGYNAASTLTNVDNTIAGSGDLGDGRLTLINEAAGVIDATGVIFLQTSTLQNAGLLEATGSGKLDILDITVDDTGGGTILAGTTTAHVYLNGADVLGGTIGGVGVIDTVGQDNTLDGTTQAVSVTGQIVVQAGTALTLAGTIDNTGRIVLEGSGTAADLFVAAAGATLTGGGVVVANATGLNQIGADAPAILTNVDNRINGPGTLGDANLTLINEAAGIIYAGAASALTIDTGANIIQNAGLIEGYSAAGVVVKSAVDNTGNLVANGGSLTIDGAVTGSGVAHINNGALTFGSSFDETVIFSKGATSGTLVLAQSAGDTAAIYGFSTTGATSLDLQDIAFATASESYAGAAGGGILTVTDGTHTARIKLFGDFLGSSFDLSKDAGGGVIVTDPPKTATFVATMASFGAPSHAAAAIGAGTGTATTTRLATPANG